jgi:hypothetical protein
MAETPDGPDRAVVRSVISGTAKLAGDSSVAFRVGVITSDKGYDTVNSSEVNDLLPIFFEIGRPLI